MATQHPVPRVDAPWSLEAETYMLFHRLPSLPAGAYDPLESAWADPLHGEFKGGLGSVMIVRYADTPVGPYDELAFIPGNFSVPQPSSGPPSIPKEALRITRIYVSQRTTMYNGRLNWNIPKHLARFEFSAPVTQKGAKPPEKLTVKVFAPGTYEGDGVQPFFACTLTPWKWVPAVPVHTKYVPLKVWHVQPPMPQSTAHGRAVKAELSDEVKIDPYDVSEKNEAAVAVGTEFWCAFDVNGKVPRARGCWVEVLRSETGGDEKSRYFPQDFQSWSVGGWMEGAALELDKPLEWKL